VKILFDEQIFVLQRHGGISRYFVEIASRLSCTAGMQARVFAPLYVNSYLREARVPVFGMPLPGSAHGGIRAASAFGNALFPAYARLYAPGILHQTYYQKPRRPRRASIVLTVFDMIWERLSATMGHVQPLIEMKRKAIDCADCVIAISEHTKRDLISLLDLPAERIAVVHLGGATKNMVAPREDGASRAPYFLFVGMRSGYKNFRTVARAFAASPRLARDYTLVCFGGGPATDDERALLEDLGIASSVSFLQGTDRELAMLYRDARALTYPSTYEGFGIPPLEAMSLGCPVICAATTSLPEVVGASAFTCDVTSEDALRAAMEHVGYYDDERARLVSSGYERASRFSWERCARETAAVYDRLVR
jgi:glycosyltransferase involved in cell wall biosynthesis